MLSNFNESTINESTSAVAVWWMMWMCRQTVNERLQIVAV